MRIAKIILMTFVFLTMLNCLLRAEKEQQPGDMPASSWMQFDADSRFAYVYGFLGGMNQAARALGAELVATRAITYGQLSEKVYMHLLAHPELRSGPIGLIVLDSLKGYFILVDRTTGKIIK